MKTIHKIIFFIFSCLALVNTPTFCLFYNDGRPSNALTGAAIGGLAGGRKGAGIGLGVGLATDVVGNAAADSRRRRYYNDDRYYDDGYYDNDGSYNRRYSRKYYRSKPSYRELQRRNAELERQLNEQ